MKSLIRLSLLSLVAVSLNASILPGARIENIASTAGFTSSLAVDRRGTIYYTTTAGDLFRLDGSNSVLVAHVATEGIGNSGLLGMALLDDQTAVVHYTTPRQTYDVVSKIDLLTGAETVMVRFVADITLPERGTSSEHHGGNPTIAPDGSIYVGIGDYGGQLVAALPEWNGGKIFRIDREGNVEQYARGFRNPFDLAWEKSIDRLVVGDNGPIAGDEIHIVNRGSFCGWPFTYGTQPATEGADAPSYTFPDVVVPTGMAALDGAIPQMPTGILLGSFVAKAIFYFPTFRATPVVDPIVLLQNETSFIIDVVQSPNGAIFFATNDGIHRLRLPLRGDCNGDALIDVRDLFAFEQELADGANRSIEVAHLGNSIGTWGCDANLDRLITSADRDALAGLVSDRTRAVRRR